MKARLLVATLAGALAGAAIALLLHIAILNTPVQVPPHRFFWQLGLTALGGGLAGLALRAVTIMKNASPEADYHRKPERRQSRR